MRPREHAPAIVAASGGRAGAAAQGGRSGASFGGSSGGSGGSSGAPMSELPSCALELPFVHETGRGYWLGGDKSFSLPLSSSRALVTFQDSFVGGSTKLNRIDSARVGNSVALLDCAQGELTVDYAWGGAGHQHAALFDDDPNDDVQLRIHSPFLVAGELFLTATRVSEGPSATTEHGTQLIRVADPLAPISAWSPEYFGLTPEPVGVGKGVAESEHYVYLFAPQVETTLLTRVAKDRLLEPRISQATLETLRDDGTWTPGLDLVHARRLQLAVTSGLTVRQHAASGRWLALFTNTSTWPSASISLSSALAIEGPWSTPSLVYTVPQMNPQAPEYASDLYCYGAAEHPAFNALADRELLFTYGCNSTQPANLLQDMAALVPRSVRLGIPFAF